MFARMSASSEHASECAVRALWNTAQQGNADVAQCGKESRIHGCWTGALVHGDSQQELSFEDGRTKTIQAVARRPFDGIASYVAFAQA